MQDNFEKIAISQEFKFIPYLIAAGRRCEAQYYYENMQLREVNGLPPNTEDKRWRDLEDKLMIEMPVFIGFQNDLLMEALAQLTNKERYILFAVGLQEKEHTEIAREMHLTLGAERMFFTAAETRSENI